MRLALATLTLLVLPIALHVPAVAAATSDFSLTAWWTYASGTPFDTIILTELNGYSGTVTLTLSPPAGFYSQLSRENASLSPANPSVSLILLASESMPGNYTVGITATDGVLSHSLSIKYNVIRGTDPNFTVYSNSGLGSGWQILRGTSTGTTIVVTSVNGFAGTVSLQAVSFPSGLVVSLDSPSVRVQPGTQPGVTSMGLSAPATVPVGTYTIVLSGTRGPITQVVYLDIIVTYGFALTANPMSLTLPQGGQSTSTITLSSLGGWTGTTGLSASCPGLGCGFNPPSLEITDPTKTAQSILTVTAGSTTLPGSYSVNVAENGPLPAPSYTQRPSLTVVVTGPDFTVSASPNALTFSPGVLRTLQTNVTLASLDGFSDNVNTTISVVLPPWAHSPLHLPSASPSFTQTLVTPSTSPSFQVTVSVDSSVLEGPYLVQIHAVAMMPGGSLSHSFFVVATVGPDFHMSASPANLVVHQGTLAISNITFTSLNGFEGGMMLEASPLSALPPDPRTMFFPTYPVVSPGGTNSTEFVVMADQSSGLGVYNIWLIASTDVHIGHAIPMTVTVLGPVTGPDFSLSAQPSHLDLSIGSSATSMISVNSINGFRGALTLQVKSYSLIGSLSPSSVNLSPAFSANSTVNVTAPTPYQIDGYPLWYPASGNRSLLVIASDSTGFSHWVWINETVSPVKVVPSPSQLEIPRGASATSQIIVSSLSGYNLTVTISTIVSPPGPTISLSNSFINFSSSTAPISLALTVNVPSTAAQGNYVVSVTATLMSHRWFCQCDYYNITNTTPVYVFVPGPSSSPPGSGPNPSPQPSPPPVGIFGLPSTEFYGIVAATATALAGAVGYLGFRWRKKPVV